MKGAILLFSILILCIIILWWNAKTEKEGYKDPNPLDDTNLPNNIKSDSQLLYSVAIPRSSSVLPSFSAKNETLMQDLKFCKEYPPSLPSTGNPFTDGDSAYRFNQICGMCMTEGSLITGEKFPIKGSPGPIGMGIVVYPEDKQLAETSDAHPSFNCAHCAPLFQQTPEPNIRHIAINSEQYLATLEYIANNDIIYETGCTSQAPSDTVKCNNSDKKIVDLNLFYGAWNEGSCGYTGEDDPVKTQLPDNLGCDSKMNCTVSFPSSVMSTKEWEIQGRCDYIAPPLNPSSYTLNQNCLPVIFSETPPMNGTEFPSNVATPIWGYDVNGIQGRFKFTKDYANPNPKKSFKATVKVIFWYATGKVFLNGKALRFQNGSEQIENVNGYKSTQVDIPIGTSRFILDIQDASTGYPTPSVSFVVSPVKSANNYIITSDPSWVYIVNGYNRSFNLTNNPCSFIPNEYAALYPNELSKFNGNQEALANHWMTQGIHQGKSPCGNLSAGTRFDDYQYKCINRDVLAAGVDPRSHYMNNGFKEGRSIGYAGGQKCVIPPPPPPPPPPAKVRLYEHCDKAGWMRRLEGPGEYSAGSGFPADASYVTVDAGLNILLINNNGQSRAVNGPGEFNFCSEGGAFNDRVQRIVVRSSNEPLPPPPPPPAGPDIFEQVKQARLRAEEEAARIARMTRPRGCTIV